MCVHLLVCARETTWKKCCVCCTTKLRRTCWRADTRWRRTSVMIWPGWRCSSRRKNSVSRNTGNRLQSSTPSSSRSTISGSVHHRWFCVFVSVHHCCWVDCFVFLCVGPGELTVEVYYDGILFNFLALICDFFVQNMDTLVWNSYIKP